MMGNLPETEELAALAAAESPRTVDAERRRGRGAVSNATGRFEQETRSEADDGWNILGEFTAFKTDVRIDATRSIITRNDSPDISFDQSINPYRGCEHGCIYCYARPSHCYLGHSAGLDFETIIYSKPNAASLLEQELSRPGYRCQTIALGSNTDPYQPVEREAAITRSILEVLDAARHPVGIVTKSALVVRDIDILSRLATRNLVKVALSITTLDGKTARVMEPRAATPSRRLDAIRQLAQAGIPTVVMVAPIIPAVNDHEIEAILEAAHAAGARQAGYVLLRLPLELKTLFREWLAVHYPDRAAKVMKIMRSMHGGRDYIAEFGLRQRGSGPYADQIAARDRLATQRLGLNQSSVPLATDHFIKPARNHAQLRLF